MSDTHQQDYLTVNRQSWDSKVATHVASTFYDVAAFKNGKNSLNELELTALLPVTGKRLLHLQCHFGLDTLSWARLGAQVTGIDLSPKAINQANELAKQSQLSAEFICSDVYDSTEHIQEPFDIVFTSYGVLCWLPDIDRWAQTVAAHLKTGGVFYMAEFHPFHDVFDGYSYFNHPTANVEVAPTYTENNHATETTEMTWSHPISQVINALIKAGISIESVHEYDYSPYDCFAGLTPCEQSDEMQAPRYQHLFHGLPTPLIYSIKGVKKA
ncbi:class I SAM-dependent methyltransferase [Shewanella intestini]|uniref:Class I SAM-dependent methyltransferase n=1 Tax=Shewanella intestini TaxID=2017544 RepID=A0ABS5HYK5_9GAMM|nr:MULTISPECIES: class I SAM-dependent methyltransferase [Shewanella]MBR9726872.1 class I SAM-dependent methyltransferase [Shewanella intestini]MRG34562.1 methyltransferase domain-containing protein [Shewanella sp. XMDDZSB0408]